MVSIILPCFNEEHRILSSLERLGVFCAQTFKEYEILCVDDGSTDHTWELLNSYKGFPMRAIRLSRNLGKGAAVREGMLQARGAYRFFTDADLPYDLSAFSTAMDRFRSGDCDLVLGARDLSGSRDRAGTSPTRKVASTIFSAITRLMFGMAIRDSQCGLKGFTDRAATALFARCATSGYAFDVEILTRARDLGFRICKVPVILVVNQSSSIRLPRDAMIMLWELIHLFARMRLEHNAWRKQNRATKKNTRRK